MMTPQPSARYVIPGLKVGCFPYDAMIGSTLECFYSAECLNETAKWISSLPPASWPKSLNRSAHTTFQPTDTLQKILDSTMVDDWQTTNTYETYYNACAPTGCMYTISTVSNILYLISTLMGLCGGLVVGLRKLVPLLVWMVLKIIKRFIRRVRSDETIANENQGNATILWKFFFLYFLD